MKTRILAVDDSSPSRSLIEYTLKGMGFDVEVACDGASAWNAFDETPFRIVISDWRMPDMDGLKLCRKIRSRADTSYTYFILLTAELQTEENYRLAIKAGVDDFLTKPLDRFMLQTRLHVAERIIDFTREIGELQTLLPICSYCKNIRNDEEYWEGIESYLKKHTNAKLSHGICPDCYEKHVQPELTQLEKNMNPGSVPDT
jgi:DNA-binding response OmpR family regulator